MDWLNRKILMYSEDTFNVWFNWTQFVVAAMAHTHPEM